MGPCDQNGHGRGRRRIRVRAQESLSTWRSNNVSITSERKSTQVGVTSTDRSSQEESVVSGVSD